MAEPETKEVIALIEAARALCESIRKEFADAKASCYGQYVDEECVEKVEAALARLEKYAGR